ncbi:MAG: SpaH/EbpB family LPXTG-anchored major pilin [Oscillospiraceae bacterium]|nr:SpaH/EbpB family LPXTG-anchored major pilin [Oscillospiraceae bacterium]
MKKAKRFLTGLLSAALALSLCAMPAMADEGEGNAQTSTIKTSVSTIDESKTGSITIHKYLQKDAKENNDGTGEDSQTAPADAEAAEGVGFTVYQVMSKEDLLKYYNGEGATVTIDDYADVNNNKLKNGVDPIKTYGETKTDEKGVVKFDNLPIGLYVVMETSKPASVTQAVKPFLVSIPMTRKGDVKKGEEWLYDVVVYPKNSTTTGNFNLVKYGVIGNDKENKTALEGVKFKLEHLKDGVEFNTEDAKNPENWELIKPKAVGDQPAKDYFVTNDAGKISVNDLKPGTYRFTEIGYEEGKDNKYIINENDQYVFVVDQTGTTAKIPEQYTEHTDDYTVNGDTVSVYNYVPDVDKKVEKNGTWQEAADYSVGDSINYKIDVTIPENIERLKTFTVTDTPTGLTDKVDSVVVKDGDTAIANENNSVYEVKQNGNGFIVKFVPSAMAAYKGKTLTITYTAVLNKDAMTTSMGNCNTVKLDYSKNVKQNGDEEPDSDKDKKTVQDEAVVYTFKIHIDKIADDGKNTPLEGVEFDLYKQVEHGAAGAITDAEAQALGLDKTKGWVRVNKEALRTGKDGVLEVKGLENGTYKLVETKAKDGYNLLKAPVDVSLDIAYKTTWTETNYYENGVWVKRDVTKKHEAFKSDEAAPGEKMNGGTQNGSETGDGVTSTTIINRKGFNLPTTGGFGTLLFSGIGVLLVVAGVGVLLSLKKKNRT